MNNRENGVLKNGQNFRSLWAVTKKFLTFLLPEEFIKMRKRVCLKKYLEK